MYGAALPQDYKQTKQTTGEYKMDAKYKELIESVRRGEGEGKDQTDAVDAAIKELTQETKEAQDYLQALQALQMGLKRSGDAFLTKQRAAHEASNKGSA